MAELEFKLDVDAESTQTNKEDTSMLTKGMKGIMEGLGIGTGMELIAGVFKSFQPLISVISSVMKLVTILLSPVSELIIGLLIPILLIIKPIAFAINQMMMPFFLQAIEFFRAGVEQEDATLIASGFSTLLYGFQAVMIYLSSQILELVMTLGLSILADIVGLFSPAAETWIRDNIIGNISAFIESFAASAIGGLALNVVALAGDMDTTKFENNIATTLESTFSTVSEDWMAEFRAAMDSVSEDGLPSAMTSLSLATAVEWGKFASSGSTAIGGAFDAIRAAIDNVTSTDTTTTTSQNNWISKLLDVFGLDTVSVTSWRSYSA